MFYLAKVPARQAANIDLHKVNQTAVQVLQKAAVTAGAVQVLQKAAVTAGVVQVHQKVAQLAAPGLHQEAAVLAAAVPGRPVLQAAGVQVHQVHLRAAAVPVLPVLHVADDKLREVKL